MKPNTDHVSRGSEEIMLQLIHSGIRQIGRAAVLAGDFFDTIIDLVGSAFVFQAPIACRVDNKEGSLVCLARFVEQCDPATMPPRRPSTVLTFKRQFHFGSSGDRQSLGNAIADGFNNPHGVPGEPLKLR